MAISIINLEAGMPTVELARSRLNQGLQSARMRGEKAVKIIHGYGSTGRGGKIKADTLAVLAQKQKAGLSRDFVCGEEFSPFYENSRRITAYLPSLTRDSDYSRGNDGITIVVF